MKLSTSEPGMLVSALGHVMALVIGLVAFSSPSPLPDHQEAIAVELVDPSALNQVTRGERNAPKVQDKPTPRAERQSDTVEHKEAGDAKADNPAPPSRPPELKTAEDNASAPTPPARPVEQPKPEVKPPEPAKQPPQKSEAAAAREAEQKREELAKLAAEAELASKAKQAEEEAKAAAKAKAEADAQAKKAAEAKAKAEALAKAEAEKAAKEKAEAIAKAKAEADQKAKLAAEAKAKQEAEAKAKKEAQIAKNFNASDIERLLQSKEKAQSTGASAPQINRTASLGTRTGSSQKLSPSLRAQLIGIIQDQLLKCWNVPIALANAHGNTNIVPSVRMKLNTDGSLAAQPGVINSSADPLFRVAADSALTATRRCAPLRIPAQFAAYYDDWRDVVVNFDARDVL
ncbi:MAG: cell envelope integrity protein TolA [Bosea sp.]|uniref:cell envelope integrity protein TolA n=1 Tax=unclassified Bosea (in: a-proteobacteria) TaxID=2653178 RepID=UPI001AC9FB7E|nr:MULTISPECIES: cell envelope integrity protein TolA [unclassified Bosea (in: a-proteobacteria)]MBN9458856.1 cell envelope integrity protein TolA [Bosea sp. (in: a-proteobacteria)]